MGPKARGAENMEVRPLNFQRKDEIVIASVLDGGWVEVIGGEEFQFPQFAQFRVSSEDGNYLLDRAENAYQCRAQQRKDERNMWARMISSLNQFTRDKSLKFCDVDGNPRSPEMPIPPLVNLSTDRGREIYKKAYDRAKAAGVAPSLKGTLHAVDLPIGYNPDPDLGDISIGESPKFLAEAFEETEHVPRREDVMVPPVTATAQVEEAEPAPKLPVKIPKPSAEWAENDLLKFAQSKGYTVTKADLKVEGKVLELALRAHADHCKRLTAGGIQYVEE